MEDSILGTIAILAASILPSLLNPKDLFVINNFFLKK